MNIIKGKTRSGYEYEIDERAKQDWKIMKLFQAMTDETDEIGQINATMELVNFILPDGGDSLEDHIRKLNDGFCPTETMVSELSEIIASEPDLKKS